MAKRRSYGETAEEILQNVFGFSEFRPTQRSVIESVLAGNDTLAVMPTGGGKSLCYQLPALMFDGLTVVVSPLISLMQDQLRHLHAAGVPATVLNSALSSKEYSANRALVASGAVKLLYVAPETLLLPPTLELLRGASVACVTIDEAHCISSWGHDFRPEYRQLASLRSAFADAVWIALTATATPRVQDDIASSLGMRDDARFVATFDRPNLMLSAEVKEKPLDQLLNFIDRVQERSGIVYCATRKNTERIATALKRRGLRAAPYHAGMSSTDRATTQELFIRDDLDIVVATVAFGMGVDKPDVRFVAHHDMPASIESYYQEVGRAGRDGLPAQCLLLHSTADLAMIELHMSEKSFAEQQVGRLMLRHMRAFADTHECRRRPLLAYFGEEAPPDGCGQCDNCIDPPADVQDVTVAAQKFLSCIYRTGQRFGMNHVIDVLRGSSSQRIRQLKHDQLSTFNIGSELDKNQWRQIARQLLQEGHIEQDLEYGGLSLAASAWPILKGEARFATRLREPSKTRERRSAPASAEALDYDSALFEVLRAKRKEVADARNVPPYVVFSDRTLKEIAARRPASHAEFATIHGVGQKKLATFADIFLAVIKSS